jgi:RNA polymerase sigma-70 factor (ECF subfamily)
MSEVATTVLQRLVDRLKAGDDSARTELIAAASNRLRRLAQKMLRSFPGVQRWEDADDVLQNASVRLHKALQELQPESLEHFLHLAALQLRRELIDLARHYAAKNAAHATPGPHDNSERTPSPGAEPADDTHEPNRVVDWTEVHEAIETLPVQHRIMFDLLWYHELTQEEAGELIGLSRRQIINRWQQARRELLQALKGQLPGL